MVIDPFQLSQENRAIQNSREQLATMQQNRQQNAEEFPLQQRIARQQLSSLQQDSQGVQRDNLFKFGDSINKQIKQNSKDAPALYQSALSLARAQGVDLTGVPQQYGPEAQQMLDTMTQYATKPQELSSDYNSFVEKLNMLPEDQRANAIAVEMGVRGRAVSNTADTVSREGQDAVNRVAAAEGDINYSKVGQGEQGKLDAQIGTKALIAGEVKQAELDKVLSNDIKKAAIDNAKKMDIWESSRANLAAKLGVPWTGTFAGLLPKITQDRRAAQGAIDAMAPVIKQLTRDPGEGTFTDQDQTILLGMLPTLQDGDQTRADKLKNIDDYIMGRLGFGPRAKELNLRMQKEAELNRSVPQNDDASIDDLINMYPGE